MKIQLLDEVLIHADLDMNKLYEVIRIETIRDDSFYVVLNENGDEYGVHDMLAKEV